ncbi:MAG: PfkB family carbohydrate kinase [Brevinema sp.]
MSKTLFLGCTVIDMINFLESYPPADVKVPSLSTDLCGGGPAFNAAITHSFLGGTSVLASSFGRDSFFKTLAFEEMKKYHIEVVDLCNDPDYHIPISTIVSAQDTGSRLIINSQSSPCTKVYSLPNLFSPSYDILLLDQHEKIFVEQNASAIENFSGLVVLDGGGRKEWSQDYLNLVDIPIVSEYFCGGNIDEFHQECKKLNISQWAVTLGAKGIVYGDHGTIYTIPSLPVKAIDTLGAGDIFHGAFCFYYGRSMNFPDALQKAGKIASYSCMHLGTRSWMKEIILD